MPLHVYLIGALNAMYDHLTTGTALPPSQIVRTVPRGPGAPSIAARRTYRISPPIPPPMIGSYSSGIRSTFPTDETRRR